MINETKKTLLDSASLIDYENVSNTQLAKEYIRRSVLNDISSNSYYSALVIKNWVSIFKIKSSVSFYKMITIEDCYDWVIDAINYVLKYKKWEDKNSYLYDEDDAFDKMFNLILSHIRIANLKKLYNNKNKSNNYAESLDYLNSEIGFEPSIKETDLSVLYESIHRFIQEGKYINAIIIDKICFSDVFTLNKNKNEILNYTSLYDQLYNLDTRYFEYFNKKYGGSDPSSLELIAENIRKKDRYVFARLAKNYFYEIKECIFNLNIL